MQNICKLIPDLEWEFIENIGVMKSDKGVTIYCIKDTEDENEDTQVTEVSEPEIDTKATENIEPVVTEAGETPGVTQTKEDANITETEEPRYEHRESSEIAAEDAVPRENSEISEDALPRYEHRESSETAAEDAVPREITKETELTGNTGISQAILVDPPRDNETTELSEQAVAEEIELTDTIEVTEVDVDMPQKENPKVQNSSEDTTEIDAEQVSKKTHKYSDTNNSLVNKIFSVIRQAKESLDTIPV